MFSGKSTELQRRIRRHTLAGQTCLIVKFAGDTRYDAAAGAAAVATHDGAAAAAVPVASLAAAARHPSFAAAAVVGVDEAQFFADVAETAEAWANAGRHVILAGLDGTFRRTPFSGLISLIPKAERVTKLSAVCVACGADAAFTRRTVAASAAVADGNAGDASAADAALIGGAEAYAAVCRGCYNDVAAAAGEAAGAVVPALQSGGAAGRARPRTPPAAAAAAASLPRSGGGSGGAKKARPSLFSSGGAALVEGLTRLELASSPMATHCHGAAFGADARATLRNMR